MAIENRNLTVGTRLVAKYKGLHYEAVVEEGPSYRIDLAPQRELQGKTYKSPSAAGSAIMGGKAVNGWRFWAVEGEQAAAAADAAESAPKAGKAAGTRNRSKKAASEAPQLGAGDYLIDSDGRPIQGGETPAAVQAESEAVSE